MKSIRRNYLLKKLLIINSMIRTSKRWENWCSRGFKSIRAGVREEHGFLFFPCMFLAVPPLHEAEGLLILLSSNLWFIKIFFCAFSFEIISYRCDLGFRDLYSARLGPSRVLFSPKHFGKILWSLFSWTVASLTIPDLWAAAVYWCMFLQTVPEESPWPRKQHSIPWNELTCSLGHATAVGRAAPFSLAACLQNGLI